MKCKTDFRVYAAHFRLPLFGQGEKASDDFGRHVCDSVHENRDDICYTSSKFFAVPSSALSLLALFGFPLCTASLYIMFLSSWRRDCNPQITQKSHLERFLNPQ